MFACPTRECTGWSPVAGRCTVLLVQHQQQRGPAVVIGIWQGQELDPAAVCGQLVCGRCGRCQRGREREAAA